MSQALLDAPAREASALIPARPNLAVLTEKMAELRFQILLTARWERSDHLGRDERQIMRSDLVRMRKQYSDKIDEIAMNFSVQHAMEAQQDVEQRVVVPAHIAPRSRVREPLEDDCDPEI